MHMTMIKTDTYHIRDTYFVDIVTDDVTYQAYLYNEEYSTKTLMFGCPLGQQSYEDFKDLVESNIEEYIEYYKEEIEDYEENLT